MVQVCHPIAITITTRNRPDLLAYTLRHFYEFDTLLTWAIGVFDDGSDRENMWRNADHCEEWGAQYFWNQRVGIANNKNRGIRWALDYVKANHIFLFDDDCMPRADFWYEPFLELTVLGIEHSMHLVAAAPEVVVTDDSHEHYRQWSNCGGYCLYFSRKALLHLEGMNPAFRTYGFEHAELTQRAIAAGFCPGYVSPRRAAETIYSLDMDLGWHQEQSPLGPLGSPFESSLEPERALVESYIEENRRVYAQLRAK